MAKSSCLKNLSSNSRVHDHNVARKKADNDVYLIYPVNGSITPTHVINR